MKNVTLKIWFAIIVLAATFAAGFGVGKLTTSSSNGETVFVKSWGSTAGIDALCVTEKHFWMNLTYPEKVAMVYGFYTGYVCLAENMNLPVERVTYSVIDVVNLITKIYTERSGADQANLMAMLKTAIWYKE